MTLAETISQLKKMGTAQNRKIYAKHGVSGEMFGVSYANLAVLKKKIQIDHDLATGLWNAGVHDAMVLATMVADPNKLKASDANRWVKDSKSYPIQDAFCKLVAQTSFGLKKAEQWIKSKDEWTSNAGWTLLCHLVGSDEVPNESLKAYLKTIESKIHDSPNRTRYAMNNCLISIGIQSLSLIHI